MAARGLRVGIVAGRFNEEITKRLVEGALEALKKLKIGKRGTQLIWVPGAFEIPQAALRLARSGKVDAIVCLGAVIRGETEHFTFIASAAEEGIIRAALDTGVPMTFGVLTTDTLEQALERSGGEWGNKGYDAAVAAVEMALLNRSID